MEHRPKSVVSLEKLRAEIARLEQARRDGAGPETVVGGPPWDRLLPGDGFRRGTLIEWLAAGGGTGVATLAMTVAREACRDGRAVVVVDRHGQFHPPAAVRLGIDLRQLVVVRTPDAADHGWAIDQSLRCSGVAAVLAWLEQLDGRTFRRWQLAAEQSGGLGLLIRPESVRSEPSWADVRLLVEPRPDGSRTLPESGAWRWRIHLLRGHGTASGRSVDVELDDETHLVHLVAELANPAAAGGGTRA